MNFENTEVMNWKGCLRGLRNPLESWNKSDSEFESWRDSEMDGINTDLNFLGENDLHLMQNLIRAGTSDSKFMRQILVCVDITAPLYWWKEFDTYKVGTVSNSTSTMHKLASITITKDCFEMDVVDDKIYHHYYTEADVSGYDIFLDYIGDLEKIRKIYLETKDKKYWKLLIQLLPESWLQKRTVTMNYENIRNMYFQRRNHKLTEWCVDFINWVKSLPYAEELIMLED